MGYDGYEWTSGYCQTEQLISIRTSSEEELYIIRGSNEWLPNNYSIITLSNANFGDLDFNQAINIADIVVMIEYIIDTNTFENTHQALLGDINQDEIINIADVIMNLFTILNN